MPPKAARRQGSFWSPRLVHQSEQPARRLCGRHRRGTFLLRGHTWLGLGVGLRLGLGLGLGLGDNNKVAQASASWLSGGLYQRLIVLQAAPSFGQPRPTRRLGRADRPYRSGLGFDMGPYE